VRLKTGDRKALAELYDNYSAALYGIISRIVIVDEVAEDVLQECFIKAWKHIDQYDPSKGRLFTWLVNIARNSSIDYQRSTQRRKDRCQEKIEDNLHNLEPVHQPNHDRIGLAALVSLLDCKYSVLIELVYFRGFTHNEVAELLKLPVGTVKTRVRKAVLLLRHMF
jgi:RNA polymerase sigma-70 factor (ECF subfamily)